jgi:RimJ/RimL family protein N-acetyltransferase
VIRKATLLDIPWLLEQAREFDKFFGAKRSLIPSDAEEATALLEALITTQVCFIAADVNGRMGFIAGALGPHYLNREILILTALLWWVDPKFRGSSAGARLLNHFIAYGKDNADWISMQIETHSPISARSLERLGFKERERNFLMEVA